MFKVFVTALVLAFSSTVSLAAACPDGLRSKEAFFKDKETLAVFTLKPDAMKKFIAHLNPIRTNNGASRLPDDAEFFFSLVEPNTNGVAWFADGCEVKDTITLIPTAIIARALVGAGITDEDMIKYPLGKDV